ncbi:MAG: energy transducer TonB [Sulfuritalea sp.]|jgi:protein TonB|nr:energy transducer TonB [Sulfuritalea sp.]
MPLYFALLLSLALHTALIVAPTWLVVTQRPPPAASIEARLIPPLVPEAMAEAVSTEASDIDSAAIPPRPVAPPRALQGSSLRRAQNALSKHLFYPPQAVAQGLEGDAILLLILADSGQVVDASIARSSGHALLDQAALDAARRIGALPGNPRQTLFPVSFRLQ